MYLMVVAYLLNFTLLKHISSYNVNSLILDRSQLIEWYPNYATSDTFNLATREIDSISIDTFTSLTQTKSIYLHDNQLQSLTNEALFEDFVNLEELYLHYNEIIELNANVFKSLKNLKSLWLQGNQLSSMDASLFANLNSLENLWLYNNKITQLDAALFSKLTNMKVLRLNNNNLVAIDRNVFLGLIFLEYVYLYENPISSLQSSYVSQRCVTNPICVIYI